MEKLDVIIVAGIINGIMFPIIASYLRKISLNISKVELLDVRFDASIRTLDNLVTKVDGLLRDSAVNREQLNYLKKNIDELNADLDKMNTRLLSLEKEH